MKTLLQYLMPKRALSNLAGFLANHENNWLKNRLIAYFINKYKPNLIETIEQNPLKYKSFNDFFPRQLCQKQRPIAYNPRHLLSPVDGVLSQIGALKNNQMIQAKGHSYALNELLGSKNYAHIFEGGDFACAYLAPTDYHRVHMPIDGKLSHMTYITGKLFSVNLLTASKIPGLYSRNERMVAIFDTQFGKMAIIMVGAMLVGSIETVWAGPLYPQKKQATKHYSYEGQNINLKQGEELGHFKMGSTVIMVFEPHVFKWEPLASNTILKRGEFLACLKHFQ